MSLKYLPAATLLAAILTPGVADAGSKLTLDLKLPGNPAIHEAERVPDDQPSTIKICGGQRYQVEVQLKPMTGVAVGGVKQYLAKITMRQSNHPKAKPILSAGYVLGRGATHSLPLPLPDDLKATHLDIRLD